MEKNYYSKSNLSFCLVQQISPEDILKYFIFGIKFNDFYITVKLIVYLNIKDSKKSKSHKNIFIYEKTYLFISNYSLCNLFEEIFTTILKIKKLNFFKNLDNFSNLFNDDLVKVFQNENNETVNIVYNSLWYRLVHKYEKF